MVLLTVTYLLSFKSCTISVTISASIAFELPPPQFFEHSLASRSLLVDFDFNILQFLALTEYGYVFPESGSARERRTEKIYVG